MKGRESDPVINRSIVEKLLNASEGVELLVGSPKGSEFEVKVFLRRVRKKIPKRAQK